MIVELKVAGEDQGLGIHYPKGIAAGSTNVGYVDLKKNSEALASLPELQGWPELDSFLRAVNLPDSLFRTLRCEVAEMSEVVMTANAAIDLGGVIMPGLFYNRPGRESS